MTINIDLSVRGVNDAIRKLRDVYDNLEYGVEQTVDILSKNGATLAQIKYGGMATASYDTPTNTQGVIYTSGDANIIAEFGAGDATVDPSAFFENIPVTDVYPGAYSEQVGSQEYYATGKWHFGGRVYTEVSPRLGLYAAKEYIKSEAINIAKGVIKL